MVYIFLSIHNLTFNIKLPVSYKKYRLKISRRYPIYINPFKYFYLKCIQIKMPSEIESSK